MEMSFHAPLTVQHRNAWGNGMKFWILQQSKVSGPWENHAGTVVFKLSGSHMLLKSPFQDLKNLFFKNLLSPLGSICTSITEQVCMWLFTLFCDAVSSILILRSLQAAFATNLLFPFRNKHGTTQVGMNLKGSSGLTFKQHFLLFPLPFTSIYLPFHKLSNDYANPKNSQNKFWSLCGILKEM